MSDPDIVRVKCIGTSDNPGCGTESAVDETYFVGDNNFAEAHCETCDETVKYVPV